MQYTEMVCKPYDMVIDNFEEKNLRIKKFNFICLLTLFSPRSNNGLRFIEFIVIVSCSPMY